MCGAGTRRKVQDSAWLLLLALGVHVPVDKAYSRGRPPSCGQSPQTALRGRGRRRGGPLPPLLKLPPRDTQGSPREEETDGGTLRRHSSAF